jgi:hypothetical protein
LAGIHAAAQFVAGLPEGGVEFGLFDGHRFVDGEVQLFGKVEPLCLLTLRSDFSWMGVVGQG